MYAPGVLSSFTVVVMSEIVTSSVRVAVLQGSVIEIVHVLDWLTMAERLRGAGSSDSARVATSVIVYTFVA